MPAEHQAKERSAPARAARDEEMRVGAADDHAEQVADALADAALARLAQGPGIPVSPPGGGDGGGGGDGRIRRASTSPSGAIGDAGGVLDGGTQAEIEGRRGGGQPLPGGVRSSMESAFGRSFGNVRVHRDAGAARISRSISADAFTLGTDIFFGEGVFDPATEDGRHVLAHELGHVVAGADGVRRKKSRNQRRKEARARAAKASEEESPETEGSDAVEAEVVEAEVVDGATTAAAPAQAAPTPAAPVQEPTAPANPWADKAAVAKIRASSPAPVPSAPVQATQVQAGPAQDPKIGTSGDVQGWRATNMASASDSLDYHHGKHGAGKSRQQYAADARAFASNPTGQAKQVTLADGSVGTKYRTPGGQGGILDANGRIITFWYD